MEITFDRVSKKFGRNEVIKDISFHIKSNTIVGLKGINGSGKTMIMRLIAGLIYPTHGFIHRCTSCNTHREDNNAGNACLFETKGEAYSIIPLLFSS